MNVILIPDSLTTAKTKGLKGWKIFFSEEPMIMEGDIMSKGSPNGTPFIVCLE